jgi:hypothetical protein
MGFAWVCSTADYQAWLAAARQPLRRASILAHDAGICRGELLALQWDPSNWIRKPLRMDSGEPSNFDAG